MERILKVSYGYLRFTFGAMVASAMIFSLAGLAMKSPRVCFIVVVLGIAAFFLGKSELGTRRKRSEARKRKDNPQSSTAEESISQWATLTQAALLISSVIAPRPARKVTVVVNEWRHKHDQSAVPEVGSSDKVRQDEAGISLAQKAIEGHKDALARAGFGLAFISKGRTGDFLAAYQKIAIINLVHPFPNVSYIPGDSNIVIGFILLHEFVLNPENEIAEILKGSFDLVKDITPSLLELPTDPRES
jgi:hypothetical protein